MSLITRAVWLLMVGACSDNHGTVIVHDGPPGDTAALVDAEVDAMPDPDETLSVTTSGHGTGMVISDVEGISCGASCTHAYPFNTVVTLTATPSSDSLFTAWGGACASVAAGAPCVVTLDHVTDVSVVFDFPHLVVGRNTIDGSGELFSSVGNIHCTDPIGLGATGVVCDAFLPVGTVVTITATAIPGSALHAWDNAACPDTGPCTLTMISASTQLIARFGQDNSVDNGTTTFTATKEGNPAWEVTGWQVTSVYDTEHFTQNVTRLWANHAFNTNLNSLFPMTAHGPPYDTEVAQRYGTLEWNPGSRFRVVDWGSNGKGRLLLFAGVIIPTASAPTGSTRDYAAGPILPRDFVLSVDADLFKDTTIVDANFGDGPYPTLAELDPASTEDGESHKTLTFGDGAGFIATDPGNYHLHVHVFEVATPTNGWQVDIPFVVDP